MYSFVNHGACFHFRAEFTEKIVTPALGVSGVGGSMAVYGAFDAIVSSIGMFCFIVPLISVATACCSALVDSYASDPQVFPPVLVPAKIVE